MGTPENVGADVGLFNYENAEYLDAKGINGYIPDNFFKVEEEKKTKRFRKSQFTYRKDDSYTCPQEKALPFFCIQKRDGKPDLRIYKGGDCPSCPVSEKCTRATREILVLPPSLEHYYLHLRWLR